MVLVGFGALWAASARGEGSPQITRIEEDWKIEIGAPDPDNDAPQISIVCAPHGTLSRTHAVFEVNHATQPEYFAGGLQLQRWRGDSMLAFRDHPNHNLAHTNNEIITFTMAMKIDDGQLHFEVLDGSSTTWGAFGDGGHLKSSAATWWNSFSSYDPETSLTQSRVGYASHRVRNLTRTAVRYYSGDSLVASDASERTVHQYTGE
jgi:hypothetical protein